MRVRHAATAGAMTVMAVGTLLLACHEPRESQPPTSNAPVLSGPQLSLVEVAPGHLVSPVRIASGKKETFYISDFLAEAIVEVEASGAGVSIVTGFAVPGRPLGVAWAKGNRLLVGNATTRTVDVYRTSNGKWLLSLGSPGTFGIPGDIAVDDSQDLVFVVDGPAKTVRVFDLKDGSPLYEISGPGPGDLFLQNPTGVAVDAVRRQVLISDYGEPTQSSSPPSVKIYTYDGNHVKTISGRAGMIGQRFSRPQGLAVDDTGRILLVDAVAGEVLVLDYETGAVVETLGRPGSGPGELWLPLDVVVDENRGVFVTNNRPRRVEVFSLGGGF